MDTGNSGEERDSTNCSFRSLLEGKGDKTADLILKHYSDQFSYHAAQRLTTFRYFVTAFSIFSAAYATLLTKDGTEMLDAAAGVALVAYLMVLCFARLDKRNEQIILINEEPVRAIQREIDKFLHGKGYFSTFDRTDTEKSTLMTFGTVLPIVFMVTGLSALAAITFSIGGKLGVCITILGMIVLTAATIFAVYVPNTYREKNASKGHCPTICD